MLAEDKDQWPLVQRFKYDDRPESTEGLEEMQFRLVYQGKLHAASPNDTRVKEKHIIRKSLHRQLSELWKVQLWLRGASHHKEVLDRFARCGYRFVPLICGGGGPHIFRQPVMCALDILFLRRDQPGDLVRSGGDIDNRIKVLFDALRMPQDCNELCGELPSADEDPFFVLLEDDRLITEIKITTDRLLTPIGEDERLNDVHLIIHVRTLIESTNMSQVFS